MTRTLCAAAMFGAAFAIDLVSIFNPHVAAGLSSFLFGDAR